MLKLARPALNFSVRRHRPERSTRSLKLKHTKMAAFRRFKPLFDRILVERFVPETRTKGGIMIPEKAQQKVNQALVVAVGAGSRDSVGAVHKVAVDVGDKVLLPEFGGTKVSFDEKDYFIFRESDILGVMNEDK